MEILIELDGFSDEKFYRVILTEPVQYAWKILKMETSYEF